MASIMKLFFTLFAASLIFASAADAKVIYTFSCFGKSVENGDTTYSVLKKCGEPTYKETLSNKGCTKIEKWHYDCKGRGNVEGLIFKKGILTNRISGEKSAGTQTCN